MDGREYERYCQLIREQCEVITPETRFADLGIDSLDAMNLVMTIEEEFGVHITDTEFDKCPTVGALWNMVKGKIDASEMDR